MVSSDFVAASRASPILFLCRLPLVLCGLSAVCRRQSKYVSGRRETARRLLAVIAVCGVGTGVYLVVGHLSYV